MVIKALIWNANSIITKKPELTRFLAKHPHDILLISETRLKENTSFDLPSFTCYRNDRDYGGVAIFIKSKIPHSSLVRFSSVASEAISIKIHDSAGDFNLSSIYCSPSSHLNRSQALDFFRKVLSISGPSIIAGDFNAKHPAWNNITTCRRGTDLFNICTEKNYSIHPPSDITLYPHNGGKPSIVDFAISKMIHGVSNLTTINDLSSDHLPISFEISGDSIVPDSKIPNFKKANWNKFRSEIVSKIHQVNSRFPVLDTKEKLDDCVNALTEGINSAAESSIPKKNPYKFRYPYSDELHNLVRHRNF